MRRPLCRDPAGLLCEELKACRDHLAKPLRGAEVFAVLARHLDLEWVMGPSSEPADDEGAGVALTAEQQAEQLALARRGNSGGIRQRLAGVPGMSAVSPGP